MIKRQGQKYIKVQLKCARRQLNGVKKLGDIEYVHRLRVAFRRLLNALWVFKHLLPEQELKKHKKNILRVASILGQARDSDIQNCILAEFRRKNKSRTYISGLSDLQAIFQKKRRNLQPKIIQAVIHFEEEKTLSKIEKVISKLKGQDKKKKTKKDYILAKKRIAKRMEEFFSLKAHIFRPNHTEELHKIRVAARHLRYTLEIFKPLYGSRLDVFIEAHRQIQSVLGKLHDIDVLIDLLAAITPNLNDSNLTEANRYFLEYCRRCRGETYRRFLSLWEKFINKRLWDKLSKQILSPDKVYNFLEQP